MPSSMTHGYFSLDVYDKLSKKYKTNVNLDKFRAFSQGPDFYYFYHFLLNKDKDKYYGIGRKMHRSYVFDYFYTLINYINDNNLFDNSDVKSYLYGHICHYILDSTCHPFIFYKTGVFKKKNKKTYKYNSLHADMEYYIDAYLIYQREKILPHKYKVYDKVFNVDSFNNELSKLIDRVMKEVYDVENASKIYLKGIKRTKLFFRLFCNDEYGIKKIIYNTVDKITPSMITKISPLSYYGKSKQKINYLNLDKKEWNHPCDIDEKFNYSFIELYLKAIDKSVKIIKDVSNMLENKKIDKEKLSTLLQDNSYLTGKNWKDKNKIQYFEF